MSIETYKVLIENVIAERAKELQVKDLSEAFEHVASSLILEKYDLTIDAIEAGLTDGGGDGQIDAMYVVVNDYSLSEEEDDQIPEKGPVDIDIILIQSKNTDSFEENPLKLIRATVADLLNLERDYSSYLPQYSTKVQDKFELARVALLASAGRAAKIKVRAFYATKASTSNIHANVKLAAEALKNDLTVLAASQDVEVNFLGAEELITLSRQIKTQQRALDVKQSLSSDSGDSFACLVSIGSLIAFLSDSNGVLVRSLFDANVRDFLGKTEVNDAIRDTLASLQEEDFWWFNNGVTIVTSAVDQKGKKLVLTEPLLVNGLQTSSVLHAFMTDATVTEEKKAALREKIVLLKVIVPPNEQIRDEIIKATNSQTHIPKPYLRGMDLVHRNIEDHLKPMGLFYERRKNQYKNAGKKRSSIVTLTEASQAFMAAFMFRGADARGRPNSLLKKDEDYANLFSESYHLDSFKNVLLVKRRIMSALAALYPDNGSAFRNDVIFHVLAFISRKFFHTMSHATSGWRNLEITDEALEADIKTVVNLFTTQGGTDKVAKSPKFDSEISTAAVAARNKSQSNVGV